MGLITSCAETFFDLFPGAMSYRSWAILFTGVSFLFSNLGLNTIIAYSLPVLMFLYPLAISLILLAMLGRFFGHDRTVYIWVTVLTLIGAFYDFVRSLPTLLLTACRLDGILTVLEGILPLAKLGLFWLCPAAIGFAIGLAIHFLRGKKAA